MSVIDWLKTGRRILSQANAHRRSQRRWRSDEIAPHLTWDRLMTGDSLWDLYQRRHDFNARDRILEIGPGYGRLLKTALEREFASPRTPASNCRTRASLGSQPNSP